MTLRVVSLPAIVRMRKNWSSSSGVSRVGVPSSSSTSAWARMLHTSSVGLRRFSSPSCSRVPEQRALGGGLLGVRDALERVRGTRDDVGPAEDVRTIGLGDAHDVADQVHRQLVRDVADEVDVVLLRRGVEDLRRALRDQLVEASDHPRREPRVHQLAHAGVTGRVRRDDRVAAPLLGRLGEARTLERAVTAASRG